MEYLIGDVTRGSPTLEEVQQGLWQKLPPGHRAEMWELENGKIHRLTMATYVQITGWTQITNRDSKVKWRRTLPTDKAADREGGTVIIDARGVL